MREPIWIDEQDARIVHERLIVLHGGVPGVRDEALLRSALARPKQHAAYAELQDPIQLAAFYTAGIVKNHPFLDGNKRTGLVLGILFLELNGHAFAASQENAANAVLALAAGRMDEREYAAFLAANVAPAEA